MTMADRSQLPDSKLTGDDLYREESFTDRRIGSIQRLTPVKSDGSDDASRTQIYVGQTQLMTPAGALPLNFEIEASSLDDAIAKFGAAAQEALVETMQRLEEMRRESASSIIVPGAGGPPGVPGGGGLKLP
jgi:hypothetical protein